MSSSRSIVTRRHFLRTAGQAAAVAAAWGHLPGILLRSSVGANAAQVGDVPFWKLALHNHGSFSEGYASWYAALAEADANGIDVIYATDHDWRMQALRHRPLASFASSQENWAGSVWTWTPFSTGDLAVAAGGISYDFASPRDPSRTRSSLEVAATSTGIEEASSGVWLDDDLLGRQDFKTNITGQRLAIDVRPEALTRNSWLEMRVTLSYYPELGGYPAGNRVLSYRFGTESVASRDGLTGIVSLRASNDRWTTFSLDLEADAARLFPELPDARDNTTFGLAFAAVSRNGAPARGWFDYLRFSREIVGEVGYAVQREILDSYRDTFAVETRQGDEISFATTHHTWLFSQPKPIDYSGFSVMLPAPSENAALRERFTSTVHENGGLVSFAHPFGTNFGPPLPDETETIEAKAAQLLGGSLAGNDMLEVGYAIRGNVTIDGHLGLWDILSRKETFISGFGATDAHGAETGSWVVRQNRFLTTVRAPTSAASDLKAAALAGQIWCTEMGPSSDMELDLHVEGVPMGSVSVAPGINERTVTMVCRDVPLGGTVELVQGPVDHGSTHPTASTIAILTESDFTNGTHARSLDTSAPSFVRTQVRDATGRLVAFGNPIWLLHDVPGGGIPAERRGDAATAQELFIGTGGASWETFRFDVAGGTDLLVRLDGIAQGSTATLFLKDPSGTTVAFDRSPARTKFVSHTRAQAGRWTLGVGIIGDPTSFRALVNPVSPSLLPPAGAIAAWEGWGDTGASSWQRFRFAMDQPGPVEILVDRQNPASQVNVFLKDVSGATVAYDDKTSYPKSVTHNLPVAARYEFLVKINDAPTDFDIVVRPA